MSKLEDIRARVEMLRGHDNIDTVAQDRQDLLDLLDEVVKTVKDDFRDFASNVRHNNHENRSDWDMRARTYEGAAHHVDEVLVRASRNL